MLVRDIKSDVKSVLDFCDDTTVFNRISHAVEVLANKGAWDSLSAYMDIVSQNRVITLPRDVETPIKLNINSNPSFSRTQLYEFLLNGPGNDMRDTVDYSWMNKGNVPVMAQPAAPAVLKVYSATPDDGKRVLIYGLDASGAEISNTLILSNASAPSTTQAYARITRVVKDITTASVLLKTVGGDLLSSYYPDETEGEYRQILINKDAPAVRMLYRRKVRPITSDDDWIPLQSKMSVIMMVYALETYRKGSDFQKAQAYEQQALQFLKEEQDSRNNFEIVKNTEVQPALGLNYATADSIIAADLYDDASQIFGLVGRDAIFDKITEAKHLLTNKGLWDAGIGYVDIRTFSGQYVTLPRRVDTILAMNINGQPKEMRSQWYEFHMNGLGSCRGGCRHYDIVGEVPTAFPILAVSRFYAYSTNPQADNGKFITVFGLDENSHVLVDDNGVEGLKIEIGNMISPPQRASKIDRVIKDQTSGFIGLQAWNEQELPKKVRQIGFYEPDELEPKYMQIRIPYTCAWLRIRYRIRDVKVRSFVDPIHLRSKLAMVAAMMSIKALMDKDLQSAQAFELKATQYLNDEENMRHAGEALTLQVGRNWGSNYVLT